jgi:hypothetical protein
MKEFFKIIMRIILKFLQYLGIAVLFIFLIYTIYALPATFSLPGGIRPGLESKTIEEAISDLGQKGLSDMMLIEEARKLVGERMTYCRRNSYNSYKKAFKRGYGFCQQQAFALAHILQKLGFNAIPVQAMRTQFPDGGIGGHSWVMVMLDHKEIYIDPIFYDPFHHTITFTPLSEVTGFSTAFRILSGWGAATINAHRYYTTGSDNP